MTYTTDYNSLVGKITVAERDGVIIGLWIEGQKHFLSTLKDEMKSGETPVLTAAAAWLDRYFRCEKPQINELPLSMRGSAFCKEVWELLIDIPYGETTTYGELADIMAKRSKSGRMSAQAIGGAVGSNPISIIIPCHRVIGANGSLTGYAGGVDIKAKLLRLENLTVKVGEKGYYIPKKSQ